MDNAFCIATLRFSEDTPLMVGGVVYTTAGASRDIVALDAATGELLWVHSEKEGPRGAAAPRQLPQAERKYPRGNPWKGWAARAVHCDGSAGL
jgi:hypothetical protein